MKKKQIIKIAVDVLMTISLLFQMTYELIGQATHEWQGMWMALLFVVHHILNRKWIAALFKGKYNAYRILQTSLVVLIFLSTAGSMVSGIMLSRHVFSFLAIGFGSYYARNIHMLCAYWGFTLMSIHLGLHWGMMLAAFRRMARAEKATHPQSIYLRAVALAIAGYGYYAVSKRSILEYMLYRSQFVFFDFGEPLIFFMLDYLAMMWLFVFAGYYLSQGAKRFARKASVAK